MTINFCKHDPKIIHRMCVCSAKDEVKCKYYEKSSLTDKCMWKSIQLENEMFHCSNPNAQNECRNCNQQIDEELILELEDQKLPV